MDVYLSRSTDGGNSWTDYRINDHRFVPKTVTGAVGAGNQGDNIGITSTGDKLWPLWMDDHTGIYQIWAGPVDLSTIGIRQIESAVPDGFSLEQNYPNPFNPSTVIRYSLIENGIVSLKVFNLLGKVVETLISQKQVAGRYEIDFSGDDLPSGVYYYQLNTGARSETKKMLLLR
jgi:hypothetical protein